MKKSFSLAFLFVTNMIILNLSYSITNEKSEEIMIPKANKIEKKLEIHGDIRTDNYFWMNERDSEPVIEYLNAENSYTDAVLKETEELQEKLFNEMVARIPAEDVSYPYFSRGYYYKSKYETGKEFPIYVRMKGSIDAPEELVLDVNEVAKGSEYCNVNGLSISPNNNILAYGVDLVSRRKYEIRFRDITTGKDLPNTIKNTSGNSTWANDNVTLFYTRINDVTIRSEKIYRYNTETSQEDMVYFEEDETFNAYVYKTRSRKYIVFASGSTVSNEYSIVPADNPTAPAKVFNPRKRDLEYSLDHAGDKFYMLTNDNAKNFRLMYTDEDKTAKENWKELIAHDKDVLIEGLTLFKDYLLLEERTNGLRRLRIANYDGTSDHVLKFDEPVYTVFTMQNYEYETDTVRLAYFTLKTPQTVFDYNVKTREFTLLKKQEVPGGYNEDDYIQERIFVTARDGVKVPVSLVYKKGITKSGNNPTLLYGYGSYGASMDPYFSPSRVSLLERGFVFALAHIRGGEEMGRFWYEEGKLFKKMNTFNDFIDVAKFLIEEKYTSPEHLAISGGSAGGLLVGAVINMEPQLFKAAIAAVPFVDVVTTMLDESIPLTTGEYDEWGNPNNKDSYKYMLSYSPYDNIKKQDYPNILITTGYHDSQVQYWEPAKWTAKLREYKTDNNLLLLKTDMSTGHGGKSGRFKKFHDVALDYAFLFKVMGVK